MTIVEKVLFLQDIQVFEHTSTEDLSFIAAITEEVWPKPGTFVFKEGEPSDAMYLVLDGQVRLARQGQDVMVAGKKEAFGTWALFDDEPRVVTAESLTESHLLRIDKEDFFELLADHTNITQSILKSLSKRLRNIMERVSVGNNK